MEITIKDHILDSIIIIYAMDLYCHDNTFHHQICCSVTVSLQMGNDYACTQW